MKKILILAAATCFVLSLIGCQKQEDKNQIKVGAIFELTGSIPAVGASGRNAAEMAVKQINEQGGILINGKKMPVKLLVEDNAATADQSAAATQKLISSDKVLAIVGPNASLGAIPASEVAEAAKTVLITPWSTNPKATLDAQTGKPKQYVFRACFIDPFEGKILAHFAFNQMNYRNAAVLYDVGSEAPTSQALLFKQDFEQRGGKIVAFETYSTNDKDFSAQLTKIKASNPDVIFLPAYYNDVPLVAQQAKRLGITAPLLGSDAWSSPDLIKLANGSVEGDYFANHYSPDAQNPVTIKFVQDYQKLYGQKPDDVAALTYDAFQVLFNAIAAAGSLDRQAVRNSIPNLAVIDGVTGKIKYSPNSGDPEKSAVIMQVKGDKFVWVANESP